MPKTLFIPNDIIYFMISQLLTIVSVALFVERIYIVPVQCNFLLAGKFVINILSIFNYNQMFLVLR